jgi:hypothetical protein
MTKINELEKQETTMSEQFIIASWYQRLIGFIIDYALVFGIITAIATFGGYDNGYYPKYNHYTYLENTVVKYYSDSDNSLGLTEKQWISYLSSIVLFVYLLIFESLFNVTLGKLITCTYVRKEDNLKRVGFWRILLRTVCRLIPFDGLSYLAKRPIGWHDSLSGTVVVNSKHNYKTFYDSVPKGFKRLSLFFLIYPPAFIAYWMLAFLICGVHRFFKWVAEGFKEDSLK